VWGLAILMFSWAAFVGVSIAVATREGRKTIQSTPARESGSAQLNDAIRAFESGGASKLALNLRGVYRSLSGRYFLLDANGKDLANGRDRSALVAGLHPGESRQGPDRTVVYLAAADGRYSLLWVSDWTQTMRQYLSWQDLIPFYLPILIAVGSMFWLLAARIASPIRVLAQTVDRFGSGDLAARVRPKRKDEIGDLGRSFDRMAGRIEELLTAERRLLQDISHELRSPLARLSFAAELVKTADDKDAAVGRLRKEISRLTNLVGALIQVTRAEGDASLHHSEEIQFDELMHEVVMDCTSDRCTINLHADAAIVTRGDRELLRRAIENVLQNAIRYTPVGATVDVTLGVTQDMARLTIRDFGPGVPDDALDKIFQPFFRVDDSRDNTTGGVGLGLSIAFRAVGLHHGKLRAEAANPGLRVVLELPVAFRS
jgi:two-component system sensor histidine kinase CpxA